MRRAMNTVGKPKGKAAATAMRILRRLDETSFLVLGEHGKNYVVSPYSCNCSHFLYRKVSSCKHIEFLKKHLENEEANMKNSAVEKINRIRGFVQDYLREGVDYATLPGMEKPTLLLPGAEKLMEFLNVVPEIKDLRIIKDTDVHSDDVHVICVVELRGREDGNSYGSGIGAASTLETQSAGLGNLACPACGAPTIRWDGERYVCRKRIGGCGAIYNNTREMKFIRNPADAWNSTVKRARKRALIDAVLTAACLHEFATQDIESPGEVPDAAAESVVIPDEEVPPVSNSASSPRSATSRPSPPSSPRAITAFDRVMKNILMPLKQGVGEQEYDRIVSEFLREQKAASLADVPVALIERDLAKRLADEAQRRAASASQPAKKFAYAEDEEAPF